MKSGEAAESAVTITVLRKGDGYEGTVTGVGGDATAVPLTRVTVTGMSIVLEAAAESKLGPVTFSADLAIEGNALKGIGTVGVGPHRQAVTLQLQRRPRQEVLQPTVKQSLAYFVGRWTFEYTGAEMAPLSGGTRSGAVTFTRDGTSNFATGRVDGELAGKKFQETVSLGFDDDTGALVFIERRPGGSELVSVASWRSPLAIAFKTAPVQAGGKTWQLRRVIQIRSETAFDVNEEFSVDGGPFRRLGASKFTRAQ